MNRVQSDTRVASSASDIGGIGEWSPSNKDHSAVSWGAIIAGGVGAAALSMILLILGTGLGLSSVSPWSDSGISATTFGVSTILWLTFTQIAASGMGGYLAGRLRSSWREAHTDEIYFRDTAHGFLAWAVAALTSAILMASVVGSVVAGGAKTVGAGAGMVGSAVSAGAGMAGQAATQGGDGPTAYFMDSLFRKPGGAASPDSASAPSVGSPTASANMSSTANPPIGEVSRIFANAVKTGSLSPDDTRYVGQLIAARTGMSQQDAEKRVSDTYARLQTALNNAETQAKDAANKARKASAYAALWLFISLLIGAFAASWAATFGGRRRDL